jgi:cyclopropane fatty-acyl-phospholipid synthase-like methyltransferase
MASIALTLYVSTGVRDYYEQLRQRPPETLHPPELKSRARLLRRELRPGDRVLDLGCGEGTLTPLAEDAGAATVLGLEVAQAAIDRATKIHPDLRFELVSSRATISTSTQPARFRNCWSTSISPTSPSEL